jgi:hypothetical protein
MSIYTPPYYSNKKLHVSAVPDALRQASRFRKYKKNIKIFSFFYILLILMPNVSRLVQPKHVAFFDYCNKALCLTDFCIVTYCYTFLAYLVCRESTLQAAT